MTSAYHQKAVKNAGFIPVNIAKSLVKGRVIPISVLLGRTGVMVVELQNLGRERARPLVTSALTWMIKFSIMNLAAAVTRRVTILTKMITAVTTMMTTIMIMNSHNLVRVNFTA